MTAFQPVRDIPHVEGAFVFDSANAAIVANDLQPLFRQDMLAAAAKRAVTMFSIADLNFEVCDEWVIQFDRYHLIIRRSGRLSICVVSREVPRLSMLRMAMSVVLHDINQQLSAAATHSAGYPPESSPRVPPSRPAAYASAPRPAAPPTNPSYAASRPPMSRPPLAQRPTPQQQPKASAPGAPTKKKNGIWG
jgi:hypothetical protein